MLVHLHILRELIAGIVPLHFDHLAVVLVSWQKLLTIAIQPTIQVAIPQAVARRRGAILLLPILECLACQLSVHRKSTKAGEIDPLEKLPLFEAVHLL